jgi:transketolase
MNPYNYSIEDLKKKANEIRQDLIKMLVAAGSGHSAGPLGMADIFTAFYFKILNYKINDASWSKRDRLILSNGHICPIRYVAMIHAGLIDKKYLLSLRKLGSPLQGHPHVLDIPALETSSGPLGEGLSQAVGMALGARIKGEWRDYHIYCLMSDAEQQEGMTWEAAMLAGKERLMNLTGIIDRNNIQIDGFTEDVMPLEPLREKYQAFGWQVLEMNGHNFEDIIDQLEEAKAIQEAPVLVIANTIPGKGVSFMENRFEWHGVPPGQGPTDKVAAERQMGKALEELRTLGGRIEAGE